MSAYACEPGKGSEPGAGWAWARAAAMNHDVWLLTRSNNAAAIDAALAAEPSLRVIPVYLDLPAWARWWKKGGRGVLLYYLLWQVLALRAARRMQESNRFDVAHHVTFATDWLPAAVAFLRDVPCVWGPVGGSTTTPWALWRWLGWRGVVQEAAREVATRAMRRALGDPTARRSSVVIAQNEDVRRRFATANFVVVEPHTAIDDSVVARAIGESVDVEDGSRLERRAAFVGRAIPWKGLRLAVAALAEPDAAGWHLDVFGAGRELKPAIALAARLGVADRLHVHGQQDRRVVLLAVRDADALIHPGMHDSAPWAVGEALTMGCPVVCLDRGGPPVLIGDDGGFAVPATRDAPAAFARALRTIAEQNLRAGTEARARVSTNRLRQVQDLALERACRRADRVAI